MRVSSLENGNIHPCETLLQYTTQQQSSVLPQPNPPRFVDSTSWLYHHPSIQEQTVSPHPTAQAGVWPVWPPPSQQWKPSEHTPILQWIPAPQVEAQTVPPHVVRTPFTHSLESWLRSRPSVHQQTVAPPPAAQAGVVPQPKNAVLAQWKLSQRAPIIQIPTPHVHPQVDAPQFAPPARNAFRAPSPTRVILPLATEAQPEPIEYQTLDLLLSDLNRLLCTPHEEQPFHFRGTCAIVLDPAIGHAARVTRVAWAIIRGTVLAFKYVPNLFIQI